MTTFDRRYGVDGSMAYKVPCLVATTGNITLDGLQTIDGVTVESGDRVLVRAQTSAVNNGIYVAAEGTWRRAPDFDGPRDVTRGTQILVTSGSVYASAIFIVATVDPFIVGVTEITFTDQLMLGFYADDIYGMIGDDTTDDTAAFTLAGASGRAVILRPGRTYKITDRVLIEGSRIVGDGTQTIRQYTKHKGGLRMGDDSGLHNVTIEGMTTRGFAISAYTRGSPTVFTTSAPFDFDTGASLYLANFYSGPTLFENRTGACTKLTATTFSIPIDSSGNTITNAANNGSGLIRITFSGTNAAATGDTLNVNGVVGTTEANGEWVVTVISSTTVDLQGSTFVHAYTSGGTLNRYLDFVSGTVSHRPSSGGEGFSGWQAITGAQVVGDNVTLENLTVVNFYSAVCWRGPIVLEATSSTGYDHSVQASGFRCTNLKADTCDFAITGTAMLSPYVDGVELVNGTHNTVPPHVIYGQSPTVSGVVVEGAMNNGAGLVRLNLVHSFGLTTGFSATVRDIVGTTEANGTWLVTTYSAVNVSGAVDNGSGLIRITTATNHNLRTSNRATIANVGGVPNASDQWVITRISDTVIDLATSFNTGLASVFAGAYTSGGTATPFLMVDLQGTTFANAYVSGGSISPTHEGFIDRGRFYGLRATDYTHTEAFKFSNFRDNIVEADIEDCTKGGITLSYAWRNKVRANIRGIAHGYYGVRQTDYLGDDNEVQGGTFIGAVGAHFTAINNEDTGKRLRGSDVVAISDFVTTWSNTTRTFNVGSSSGSAIFSNCVDIQKRSNAALSYGCGAGGEIYVTNPVQRGRAGLLRAGSASYCYLTVAPANVDSWDPSSSSVIDNSSANVFISEIQQPHSKTSGVGYGIGSGAAVTQLTNKSTGVTLLGMGGTITMNNANLVAGASVSFTLTMAGITATDYLHIKHVSGGTLGSYTVRAVEAAGTATITVTNTTGGDLAQAIVLKCGALKLFAS